MKKYNVCTEIRVQRMNLEFICVILISKGVWATWYLCSQAFYSGVGVPAGPHNPEAEGSNPSVGVRYEMSRIVNIIHVKGEKKNE